MKTMQTWLDEYQVSHQNKTNKTIHWICIPHIFFTVVGFLWSIKLPLELTAGFQANVALIALALVFVYYALLSIPLAIGMGLFSLFCAFLCYQIELAQFMSLWQLCLVIFVVAWIGQFYGHNVEGKKPSFLKDLQFLMIGPAWIMADIFKRFGIKY